MVDDFEEGDMISKPGERTDHDEESLLEIPYCAVASDTKDELFDLEYVPWRLGVREIDDNLDGIRCNAWICRARKDRREGSRGERVRRSSKAKMAARRESGPFSLPKE